MDEMERKGPPYQHERNKGKALYEITLCRALVDC